MPQLQLPLFPVGVTSVTADLSFQKQAGTITYFYGSLPIFSHPEDDIQSFRMITAQFCVNGHTKQADIVRAFGLPKISVKRAVKRYRTEGPKGFYQKKKGRGPSVLTPSVLAQVQHTLTQNRDGQWQAGLYNAWQLVKLKTDGPAARFITEQEHTLLNHIKIRNSSILAHGFAPIQAQDWQLIDAWLTRHFVPMLLDEAKSVGIKELPAQLPDKFEL